MPVVLIAMKSDHTNSKADVAALVVAFREKTRTGNGM